MQKPANRILSALIALVMVLSMLPATVFATGETDALEGWSITLGENIGVKFYLNSADYTVTTTVNGVAVDPEISEKVVTVKVAAAQMTDTIVLTVKNGEETVHTGEYSVRQYAETILTGEYDVEVKEMVREMLNYGAAAQTYFNYNTEKLANAGYELETAAAVPTDVPEITVEDDLSGIGLYGLSLVFRSKTAVRFYFTVSGNIANYTFKVGETAYAPVAKDGKYYVEIGEINPQDLDENITVSVNDGAMTVTYSPLNYIVRKYNNAESSDNLKALVQAMYGYHVEAEEYASIIWAGTMSSHSNGWNADALYFSMAENAAPIGDAIRYTPTATSNIKLIRGGVTYDVAHTERESLVKSSETSYYIPLWVLGDYKPLVENDILIVSGSFKNAANNTTINISKSYVLINADGTASFSTEMPTLPTSYNMGVLQAHSSGATANGIYFATQEANDAPWGAWGEYYYDATSIDCIKLIRDGETVSIGLTDRNTIVKFGENDYFLRLESWTIGDYAPITNEDMFIVEGAFTHKDSKTTLNITKTYIYHDGTAWVFSAEEPVPETIYEVGVLSAHENGGSNTGFNATGLENDAPYSDWAAEYAPTSKECIQIVRGDTTIYRENTAAGAIIKLGGTGYYVKFDTWIDSTNYPLQAGDMIIIEGIFIGTGNYAEAEGVKIKIDKTYVVYDGTNFTFSATEPVKKIEVECGIMSEHADGSASEIYFSLAENSIPADEELVYPYAGTVQLVNGSNVSTVNANIYKLDSNAYYLELDGTELADGDYLIVEGGFANEDNGYIMNISKTYVLADDDALVYSETEPVLESEYALTGLTNHPNGWDNDRQDGNDGIYISHNAHGATYNTDWSVEYKPVSSDVIKLVRNGETYSIGQPVSGTLIAYGETDMYFKTEAWTIINGSTILPFVDGDMIIIEGKFKHEGSGDILVVEKTVICVSGSDLIFNPVLAGNLDNHSNGMNGNGEGIYATMAENAAPYDGWNIEYTPVTADAYYVIRDGEQINIGIPGRGTLVKYGDTNYYLKMNSWCTNNFAYTTDDIFVIDGFWKQNTGGSAIIKIEKTYLYHNGSAWVFATELPSIIDAGLMQTHASGMWGNGISFTMAANAAPYDEWSIEYKQTSVDNIKLIRDGETISIGIVDRPLLVKYGETDYYLKLEKWTIGEYGVNGGATPITNDDIIIIEGNFVYDNVTLKITKSYVYYDGSAWVCSAEAPAQKNVVDVVDLGSHGSGWSTGGFYFTAAANDAPYDDWSLRYKPVSADVIKCISGDTTTNVGNTGGETIVKYSDTEYYVEGWAVGSANMAAGNTFVIEGQFYNAANDVYIDVEKTYITLNADGSTTVITDSDKYINAGAMSAYDVQNWFDTNYNALYFVLDSNIAPGNTDWSVRYMPLAASNVKLIRNGETVNIGNTGAETIVKIEDGLYALALDNWWWSSYAPIQDGDQLIIEGEFANSSNGYTLKIDKTYITFVSKADDNVVFSTAASTEFGEVLLPNTNETLTIGMWNGSYHVFEDKQLQELKAAGITKIMGIDTQWIGTTDVNAWLDRVYSYGISVIMDLRSWDGETVPSYASHAGVIGFLMYDEPCATDFDTLADLREKFDAVMPEGKLFYVNLFPECAADSSLVGEWNDLIGNDDYDEYYVTQFLTKIGAEVLSWDNYSLLDGNGIRTDYFHNFEVMASKNVPMWYTMLSAGHDTTSTSYATPTEAELRWQMAVALTYGVQNIDHYTYVSHEAGYSCMVEYEDADGDGIYWETTALYNDIKNVDNEYLAWDNIFMAYDWVGTGAYSANSNNSMLTQLENALDYTQYGLASVSASENLLVGVFDYNGENAYMVTNAGSAGSTTVGDGKNFSMNDTSVTLTLAEGDYKCVAVIDNGEISYVAVNADNTVTLNVQAYEGVFVIPVLN